MKLLLKLIAIFIFLVGIIAVWGGYGLIGTNGIGMPISYLQSSPFTSFLWPGVILAVIVGGTHIVAAVLLFLKHRIALESLAIAGFGLNIWIFTEMYIVQKSYWLHALYFGIAILELIVTMLLLKYGRKILK